MSFTIKKIALRSAKEKFIISQKGAMMNKKKPVTLPNIKWKKGNMP